MKCTGGGTHYGEAAIDQDKSVFGKLAKTSHKLATDHFTFYTKPIPQGTPTKTSRNFKLQKLYYFTSNSLSEMHWLSFPLIVN